MPRVNLTDEEAAFIEARRTKNATDLAFNMGLEEAATMAKSVLDDAHILETTIDMVVKNIRSLKRTIRL